MEGERNQKRPRRDKKNTETKGDVARERPHLLRLKAEALETDAGFQKKTWEKVDLRMNTSCQGRRKLNPPGQGGRLDHNTCTIGKARTPDTRRKTH